MTLHYEDAGLRLWHGSNLEILASDALGYPYDLGYYADHLIPDGTYDSVVTDPPYELGFMGKGWDSSGIAYEVDVWRECLRVLKPGGHLLAFGGTRTWHRVAVAIEDAGFEIRDSIAWLYGSGFPKSMDVAQAIDKLDAAAERLSRAREFQAWLSEHMSAKRVNELTGTDMGHHLTTHPTQPAIATAELFDKLRPELPPVPDHIELMVSDRTIESQNWLARAEVGLHRSGISRGASGVTAAGAGKARTIAHTPQAAAWEGWGTALKPAFEPIVVARKPLRGTVAANVVAHGTGALNIDATRVPMSQIDREAARVPMRGASPAKITTPAGRGDEYFEPAAAGRFPTNVLLEESQAHVLDTQTGVLTSGKLAAHHSRAPKNAGILGAYGAAAGERGYGDSGGASRFFPTFRYEAKAPTSERPNVDGTVHATVKPLELMRWLIRLVTRPGGRVLDPFAGSGTTGEAALLEGMECDLIELEADHLPLILARVRKPLAPVMFGDWEGVPA